MSRIPIFLLAFLFSLSINCYAKETNHCHDKAAEAEWLTLNAENPEDLNLQALHALRMGLCIKVDQGMLSIEEATKIFEKGRSTLIEERSRNNERQMIGS